ncbi:MAG: hypothetical protein ACJ76H_00510 [Bacteriovoracaceae bacterium]
MKVQRWNKFFFFLLFIPLAYGSNSANYKVLPGKLHKKGKVIVNILPDQETYRVKMDFNVKKKDFVPVPSKLLKGSTIMEFPDKFRTEAGYKELQKKGKIEIHNAELRFVKRADYHGLKDAYFIEVKPKNKKSRIDIIYHPSLPSVGWEKVEITFLSKIPVLDGYELEAVLKE